MNKYLNYSVVERKSPRFPEKPGRFYAQSQSRGQVEIKELADRIHRMCTVPMPGIMAVMIAMEDVLAEALSQGEIVKLGELGSLYTSVGSRCCRKREDFSPKMINKVKVLFRTGRELKKSFCGVKFVKVEQRKKR